MKCTMSQHNESPQISPSKEMSDLLPALESFAILFARPANEDYERTVNPSNWQHIIAALQNARISTEGLDEPPTTADYRAFANRVLTNGFSTSALPVESLYKHWNDKSQTTFAHCDGCFDGLSADHVRYLCSCWGFGIPDAFRAMPDHLSILLEIYSVLIEQNATDQSRQFVTDHLDWLHRYSERLTSLEPLLDDGSLRALSFYRALVHATAAMANMTAYATTAAAAPTATTAAAATTCADLTADAATAARTAAAADMTAAPHTFASECGGS